MKSFNTFTTEELNKPHDYVKDRLTSHFKKMGVPHKVKSGLGYHSVHIGKDIKVTAAGSGVAVNHKGKEVHFQSRGKANWRKAADHAEDLHISTKVPAKGAKKLAGVKEGKEPSSSAYAIGMAQAKKSTGDEPPLKKRTITKAHKIAKAVARNEEVELTKEAVRYATDNEYALAEVGMEEDYPDYDVQGVGVNADTGDIHIMASGLTFMMDAESSEITEIDTPIDEAVIHEILSIQGRRKLGISAKRRARVLRTARLKASKRIASKTALKKRAGRKSRDFYFRKLSQGKGRKGTSLARRKEIEKRVQRFKKGVERRTRRLLPQVRKADIAKKRG